MNTSNLIRIAKEYRRIAEDKLDHKEFCKSFSEKCRADGIDWTQLKKLVDAQAADARDDKKRVEKIVAQADFASSYADLLSQDERKGEIRS